MNIGSVINGYHFISLTVALNAISEPPSPHSNKAANPPTNPIAPNTRCPVSSISIMVANINSAMNS